MAQKNEAPILALALVLTLGLIGGGFAQSSRSIKPEEYQAAQQRGFSLKEIPVAIDAIAIAVHPSLNLPGLCLRAGSSPLVHLVGIR